jgi:hypothetical protein
MACPGEINQDRLCFKCKWIFRQCDLTGDFDKCVCPKNIKKNKEHISSTCYVSGVEKHREIEYQYLCCKICRDPDPIWGVDCCGHEGLWFEPRAEEYRIELTWWQKLLKWYGLES